MDLPRSWDACQRAGVDGIEIFGAGDDLRLRCAELEHARRSGVVFSAVCAGPPYLGRQDVDTIDDAIRQAELTLEIAAAVGADGVVMPVAAPPAVGLHPVRALEQHTVGALAGLATYAGEIGTTLFVEPLNRYEDGIVNRLEQAVGLCEQVGAGSLAVAADLFHMNIEETNLAEAIRRTGARLGHVHVADSNRCQPGAGHLDFRPLMSAIREIGFDGWLTLECEIHGPTDDALRDAVSVLGWAWTSKSVARTTQGSGP